VTPSLRQRHTQGQHVSRRIDHSREPIAAPAELSIRRPKLPFLVRAPPISVSIRLARTSPLRVEALDDPAAAGDLVRAVEDLAAAVLHGFAGPQDLSFVSACAAATDGGDPFKRLGLVQRRRRR
jgi:hypothetical protein